MTGGNPVRHVLIAWSFAAILFIIAGDKWSQNIGRLQPVQAVKARGS